MRRSPHAPSIAPRGDDHDVYMVEDDHGRIWPEADSETTDFDTVVADLLTGQYSNPLRVIAFNIAEPWSRDASADVAQELRRRCDEQFRETSTRLLRLALSRRAAPAANAPVAGTAFSAGAQSRCPALHRVRSHLPAASAFAEELIAAIGLEPRRACSRRHLEPLQDLSRSRIESAVQAFIKDVTDYPAQINAPESCVA